MVNENGMDCVIKSTVPCEELSNTPSIKWISDNNLIQDNYVIYLSDESRLKGGSVEKLVFVHSEKQVVSVLQSANKSQIPVTISAGRTGIVGGAIPFGGILLSLEKMDRFLGVRWDEKQNNWCVRCQPGLSIETLNKILDKRVFDESLDYLIDEDQKELQRFMEESDQWFYPVDPTEKSAHLGGTIATNASGSRSLKFGPTRNHVMSLRVVLIDGTVLLLKRNDYLSVSNRPFVVKKAGGLADIPVPEYHFPEIKNSAGYFVKQPMDFIDFFIGSEGTLGVITEVEVALRRKPEIILSGIGFFPNDEDGIQFVKLLKEYRKEKRDSFDPTSLEYMDCHSLKLLRSKRKEEKSNSIIPHFPDGARSAIYFEQFCTEDQVEIIYQDYEKLISRCHGAPEEMWGGLTEKDLEKFSAFRHALPETVNTLIGQRQRDLSQIHKIGTDFVVTDDNLDKMIQIYHKKLTEQKIDYVIFGHIGENHLHVNMLPKNYEELERAKILYIEFAKDATALGGTVSGEHGVGKLKSPLLKIMYSSDVLQEMRKVKIALDPNNLLNRGNVFEEL